MRTDTVRIVLSTPAQTIGLTRKSDELISYESGLTAHLGIKTVHPCFHFLQLVLIPPTYHNYITFALIAKTYSYISLFNMVQIKLSVAFVLAAAAIAPVIAQPIFVENATSPQTGYSFSLWNYC